ncbi:MAG TPA: hypothetical protein VJH92_05290 [Candidatus Nanoarchaeia archaeon]|nr:hypothetical protein [Candidatus Nanoarchaeia archaeon]
MDLENTFNSLLTSWDSYCCTPEVQLSSNSQNVRNCVAYRSLSKMGSKILPLIKRAYMDKALDETTVLHGFPMLVQDIAGSRYDLPEDFKGRLESVREYTINWLENMRH